MKPLSLGIFAFIISSITVIAAPTGKPDLVNGKKLAEQACVSCHAADGNSSVAKYPRLAGQNPAYAYVQAIAIKKGTRVSQNTDEMKNSPFVVDKSDKDMWDAVSYYATQTPKQGETNSTDPEVLSLGKQIYRGGKADIKLPSCASCHGPSGAGMPPIFPRISSQQSVYVEVQLKDFRSGKRSHEMMDPIATRLTDKEISAVANYIQGLR